MGTSPETNIHFWSYLTQFFLQWKHFSRQTCRKNQSIASNNFSFENHAVYGIMWKIL